MEKLALNIQLYKYGQKNEILVYTFHTVKELEQFISRKEEETLELEREEEECGESLIKWTGSFEYNSKNYSVAIDL